MRKRRGMVLILCLMVLTTVFSSLLVNATDDKIDYSFTIDGWRCNGREEAGRYRQTTHTDNPWKVKMESSKEGDNTYTNYWLEKYDETNVSIKRQVKVGLGPYYTDAKSGASQTTVYLTAENNNFNGTSYKVSGFWDEETWD